MAGNWPLVLGVGGSGWSNEPVTSGAPELDDDEGEAGEDE